MKTSPFLPLSPFRVDSVSPLITAMDLYELDPLTLNLVVQMHLEDLQGLADTANRKGKGREGEVPDFLVATETYRTELSTYAQLLSDRAMSRSIALAVDLDADAIRGLEIEEAREARDRELAFVLSGKRDPQASFPDSWSGAATHTQSEELADKMGALGINAIDIISFASPDHAESSSWAATRKPAASGAYREQRECVACGDKFPLSAVITTACLHGYCRDCIRSLFQASFKDECMSNAIVPALSWRNTRISH